MPCGACRRSLQVKQRLRAAEQPKVLWRAEASAVVGVLRVPVVLGMMLAQTSCPSFTVFTRAELLAWQITGRSWRSKGTIATG